MLPIKLKLEIAGLVRVFADLSRNYTDLVSKPLYSSLFVSDAKFVDETVLRQFEKKLEEGIKVTRELVKEARESFDIQLKIQKVKDNIFALNEQLNKAKKRCLFKLDGCKVIPKSLHCVSMLLMEDRIKHLKEYMDEETSVPEFEDPNLYHYAIFSDNVVAASIVVNYAAKNTEEPWKHVCFM